MNSARSAGRQVSGPLPPLSSGNLPPIPTPGSNAGNTSGAQPAWRPPPPPASIGPEIIEEFKGLAVLCAQLAERMASVEQDVKRLNRENQEIRELLIRRS